MTRRSDYTLIELVVAVAIFATVILMASMGLMSVQQTWRRIHSHGERFNNMLKIDRVIENSFRNIIPFSWTEKDTQEERPVFLGEPERIIFASRHRITSTSFSAIRFVSLFLDDDKLIAEYRDSPILEWSKDENGLKREVLAHDVESIKFRYADLNESESIDWIEDWDEENSKNFMPLAVQLEVVWKDGTKERWLRRTAGSGKFETFGVRESNIGLGRETGTPNELLPSSSENDK